MKKQVLVTTLAFALSACSNAPIQPPGDGHLRAEKVGAGGTAGIPAPVQQIAALPRPKPAPKVETYSVVVNNVKVDELLFALARDAKLNVDIHPGIGGTVTMNALDQTLPQLLSRIGKQVDMRWELNGANLAVMPDAPYLRNYKVDYVNISRDVSGTVQINTQIASTSTGASAGGGGGSGGGNNSSTTVTSKSQNQFWKSLEDSLVGILNEKDRTKWQVKCEEAEKRSGQASRGSSSSGTREQTTIVPGAGPTTSATGPGQDQTEGSASVAGSSNASQSCGQYIEKTEVIVNRDAGVVVVRATSRQHEKVQEFLDQVMASSRRQVIIEATIAEITLSDQYQQGINWGAVKQWSNSALQFVQSPSSIGSNVVAGVLNATTPAQLQAALATTSTPPAGGGNLAFGKLNSSSAIGGLVTLLETFGNVKVLSSPKISVINNQTAMLKVVDNVVYFTVKADTTTSASGPSQTTVTTTPNSVSVGLVMSVTPQISDTNNILLNIRPTISRVTGYKADPNPSIPATLSNAVPEIQTREMESMLRLADGQIAIMGGLMEDKINHNTSAIPGAGDIPILGNLFRQRNDINTKTELVILLRPVIIRDPSIAGDYREYANQLPSQDFFSKKYVGPPRQQLDLRSEPQ